MFFFVPPFSLSLVGMESSTQATPAHTRHPLVIPEEFHGSPEEKGKRKRKRERERFSYSTGAALFCMLYSKIKNNEKRRDANTPPNQLVFSPVRMRKRKRRGKKSQSKKKERKI